MGRPTKLTPKLQADICTVLAAGNYLETACAYVGVSRITVRNWMRQGARQKKGQHREFLNAIKKAMAQAEISDVATIKSAAKEQWQAAAWRLERKNWKRWGRKDKMTAHITGWQDEVVELLRASKISAADVVSELGHEIAAPLIAVAGVSLGVKETTNEGDAIDQ